MAEPSTAGQRADLYFVSAPVDGAVMGGLSIVAAVALLRAPADLGPWPMLLALVCNWPHFAASSYRLYRSRENIRQYPQTAVLVPLVVLAGCAWALADPVRIAPMYVKLMLLWSPYHFSGQTVGICLGYARRAGVAISTGERRALDAFVLSTYLAFTAHLETGPGVRVYAGLTHPKLALAAWVGPSLDVVAVVLGGVALACWLRPRADGRRVPAIVLLPAFAQAVWFGLGRGVEAFQLLVPFFHSLQYLFLAWAVQLKERLAQGRFTPSRAYVRYESLRWWLVNVALGMALFLGVPYAGAAFGLELGLCLAVFATAIQLHHFFVDGVIWKLRNPRLAAPLLVTVRECAQPPPARVAEAA